MPINLEGEMFEAVKDYLQKHSNCLGSIESFLYDSHAGTPKDIGKKLRLNNYCSDPDVYGIGGDKVYLCQGKLIKNAKGKLWEVVGQGISNRNYCHHLYIFFEKEYWGKIKKIKEYYQDFVSILKQFNIGLFVVNKDLQVEKIIHAKEQNPPKKKINKTKIKIAKILFIYVIINSIRPKPKLFGVHKESLTSDQPAFYIYLDEWQDEKKLYYFIKFYKNKVLIGINVSKGLMQEGFINRLLKNPRLPFTEYNGGVIDYSANFKKDSKDTQEFHNSIPLGQSAKEFFNDINSEKNEKIISGIKAKFVELVQKIDSEYLKTLVNYI